MAIVSMATESYVEWIFHFLYGLKGNTDEKIVIFLINFKDSKAEKLKEMFPEVIWMRHTAGLVPREKNNFENKVFKVTYLKGDFIKKAFEQLNEPILWIDITALIRSDIGVIMECFRSNDVLLMRRNFEKDFGHGVYAAEIFGLNNKTEIDRYYENCNKRRGLWYGDQIALCEIEGERHYLNFGEWSNFNYEESAKSWSDRGKTGKGKIEEDDVEWTHNKFCEDLEKKIPGYKKMFNAFKRQMVKPKILIHTDDDNWCYHNTVQEIIKNQDFEFTVINSVSEQIEELRKWRGDLVWGRCGSYRHKKLTAIRPDLKRISFSTITTGGDLLINRFEKQKADNKGEAGVIVQNESAKFLVDLWIEKEKNQMECFILPNGVDVEKFKYREARDEFVVGFSGRSKEPSERILKGFDFVKKACEMEDLDLLIASNTKETQVEFKDMPDFYAKIDVLVLLSNSEGCSNTINEAMACGLPVITYRNGYHGDFCTDEVYFINRDIKSLVLALRRFKDKNLRQSQGEKARKWAKEHSWEKMRAHYSKTFRKMIKAAKKNPAVEMKAKNLIPIPIYTGKFVEVECLEKCNLGKLEKHGVQLWFTKGMRRRLKYDEVHKPEIDRAVKTGLLKIV